MLASRRKNTSVLLSGFAILVFLSELVDSSTESRRSVHTHKITQPHSSKITPQLSFQIKLHAFLLWASVGFLMPIGILVIRMSQRVECGQRLKILFYSHVILQIVSVLLATAGAVLSVKNFENSFNNAHQRIGLAFYALLLIQPLIGLFRPHRGVKVRSLWYFAHWLLGTGICIAGIMNIYIGLHAYHKKTSRSVKLWTILFTMEVVAFAFIYLFQDRWDYMRKQGVILGQEQIAPTDHSTPPRIKSPKELGVMLQMVD
ncbi:uncharacterized protein A4U43_C05F28850 [Asparagus officinalis]|uniref:Cytochrome b561 domain-containing protein n=1 Tax=Asparagus officinalis TaxID=4686 RepID=A0A5P1F0L8_ASPOF|nr:cytochrome b561 domain-containing protein At4g18260-like [Asparagus officinalis]ONK69970.1 uncharacterized protein A4U43_C05F28850 [Asparagus officinalis]